MKFRNGKPVIRCSSLNQLISCPGSRTLAAKLGVFEEDDRASWEGQWCHYQAALRFINFNGAMPPEGGLPAPRIPKEYRPESFADWIVDFYHRSVMEETPGDWAMEVEAAMEVEFAQFWLEGHVDENAIAPDASALNFDDLKSGTNIVDAADCNWQVLGYAALFKSLYPDSLKRIRGRIIQPRMREGEGKRISAVVIDERGVWDDEGQLVNSVTIEEFVPLLERLINESLANPMMLDTGPKQCRWCPADLQCAALTAHRNKMKHTLTQAELDAVEAVPNDQRLLEWAVAKKLFGSKLDKAWAMLKARLEATNGEISGDGAKAMLRDWSGERTLSDEGKSLAWETVVELMGEKAYSVMELSVPELERALASALDLPIKSKKGDSGEIQVANRFGAHITKKTGKQLTILV